MAAKFHCVGRLGQCRGRGAQCKTCRGAVAKATLDPMLYITGWWFQIVFIFTPIGEDLHFD